MDSKLANHIARLVTIVVKTQFDIEAKGNSEKAYLEQLEGVRPVFPGLIQGAACELANSRLHSAEFWRENIRTTRSRNNCS